MTIFIKTIEGDTIGFEVVPEDTVKTLKILVAFSYGMQICIFDNLNF
jgi:hypothetical protein